MSSLHLSEPGNNPTPDLRPRITVIGVGGAGGNAVNNMIASGLEGVEFVVANTDSQSLVLSRTDRRIQLGLQVTGGLGAGNKPDVGHAAAEESLKEVLEQIGGSNMVFVAAGMGGGTGTGAAPVIARAAKEQGILTVGVVTKPFQFEGAQRMRLAEEGIQELRQVVDTLIIIPNQNLFRVANEKTTFADAFKLADDVLHSGVRAVTDLMVMPGLINLDFADVSTVMRGMGKAMMGTGEAEGEKRALDAAELAISNPLLEDASIKGAQGVLINITGGPDLTLFEADEAANRIRDEVDPDAQIIFGSTFDEKLQGRVRVSVVATGIDLDRAAQPDQKATRLNAEPGRPVIPNAPAPRMAVPTMPQAFHSQPASIPTPPDPVQTHPAPMVQPQPAPMQQSQPAPAPMSSVPQPAPVARPTNDLEQPGPAGTRIQRQASALMANRMDILPGIDDPVEQAAQEAVQDDRPPFIPAAPADPHGRRFTPRRSDPFASTDVEENAGDERPTSKRLSLYQRVTRRAQKQDSGAHPQAAEPMAPMPQVDRTLEPLVTPTFQQQVQPAPVQQQVQPAPVQQQVQPAPVQQQTQFAPDLDPGQRQWTVMPENAQEPAPRTAPRAVPHQTGEPRTVSRYDAEDQLEIPTFLRRQAN